jgi:hypothetical protein
LSRAGGDAQIYEQGGQIKNSVPPGYYIDLTQLAEDYGWGRVAAQRTWQYNFGAIQFWEFVKTDGLTWEQAMLELYTPGEFQNFLTSETPIPAPPPLPTSSPTPEIFRSPTPIPPDVQSDQQARIQMLKNCSLSEKVQLCQRARRAKTPNTSQSTSAEHSAWPLGKLIWCCQIAASRNMR